VALADRLADLFGDERHERVQDRDEILEYGAEHRDRGGFGDALFTGDVLLADLKVSRTQVVPREAVQRLRGIGELEGGRFQRGLDVADGFVQTGEDPLVRQGQLQAVEGVLRRREVRVHEA